MSRHCSLGCLGRLGFIDTLHIRTIEPPFLWKYIFKFGGKQKRKHGLKAESYTLLMRLPYCSCNHYLVPEIFVLNQGVSDLKPVLDQRVFVLDQCVFVFDR